TATFPRNIRLQARCAPDVWPVFGDAGQLQQVLLNLCVNSLDAMPEGGSLEVAAANLVVDAAYASGAVDAKPGRHVVWRVTDTGVGIPENAISQIFEPFFTTKGPNQGTGLGLSTVARIVHDHGGFVTVSSEPGRGATFRVHLPAVEAGVETPAAPVAAKPGATTPAGAGRHILVVDDEASVLESLCATLQAMGYRTSAAADGTEALIRAAEQRAALQGMVTDIHMSGIDGLKLIRTLRHMLPRLPIVVVSGRVDTAQQRELAQAGVGQIILKPFTEEQLAAALERALAAPPS
ncbi:MAG: ATP-binding protein, partial [Opitutaceae bacterium]